MLAGWQAALEHPIKHVDELGGFVHRHGGHSDGNGTDAGLLCDALAALTACAADHQVFVSSESSNYAVFCSPIDAPRVAQAPPFLSQGPPASA